VTPPTPQASGKTPAPTVPPPPPPAPEVPEALSAPEAAPAVDNVTPFAFADFTWMNATPRNKDTVLDTKFFTPEIRFDTNYMEDFNQPVDHTIVGATESFRSGEVQIEQASVGGDFHWQNVRGRIRAMTPATGSANGIFAAPISTRRKLTAGTTSTSITVLTWMPESSSPTSVCSVTTILTTGLTSLPTCPPTHLGFSTACVFSGFPRIS